MLFRDEKGYLWEYGAHSHRLAYKGIANEVFKKLGDEIEFLPEATDAKLIFKASYGKGQRPRGFSENAHAIFWGKTHASCFRDKN